MLEKSLRRRTEHRQYFADAMRSWRAANPERNAEINRKSREKNREKALARSRAYKTKNRAAMTALENKRHAAKLRRTPAWADHDKIKEIYERCAEMTRTTGVKHEVDHIVPLQGKFVSGLHIHYNLQILTCEENRRKWNRFA